MEEYDFSHPEIAVNFFLKKQTAPSPNEKKNPKNELLKFHWTIHSLRNHFLVVNSQMPLSVKKSQGNILSWGYLKVHLPNRVIMLLPGAKENLPNKTIRKSPFKSLTKRSPKSPKQHKLWLLPLVPSKDATHFGHWNCLETSSLSTALESEGETQATKTEK